MRLSITLSYDGSAFCGWQIQRGEPSVQECLEDALSKLLRAPVSVTGAGRTDSRVNAIGYVAHFDIEDVGAPDPEVLGYKLNAILPPSIVVHSVAKARDGFHARFDASQRKYTYFLHRLKDPFVENYSLRRDWELDFEAMNRAASLLKGRHDFACFEKTGTDVKTTVCTVTEAFWAPYTPTHVALMGFEGAQTPISPSWRYAYFRISADRFLRNMVRAIVGTLLEVGRGKRSVADFATLILPPPEMPYETASSRSVSGTPPTRPASRESGRQGNLRGLAGDSVPGYALFLSGVEYPFKLSGPPSV